MAYEIVAKKLAGSTFSTLATADILRNLITCYLYNIIYLSAYASFLELRSTLGVSNMLLFPMRD